MSRLKTNHIVETLIWLTFIAVFFVYSFEFNQEIEIYIFGATGWPRVILGLLLLVTLGNFLHLYKKGSEIQQGRVGITDEEENISYNSIVSIWKLIAILCLAAYAATGVVKKMQYFATIGFAITHVWISTPYRLCLKFEAVFINEGATLTFQGP
jgi:hypothetical protein